ncbi:MAG TPA: protein kinase [Thermoanaerobaculia bacterium]|nr:protein kinase [Thermoanaerobaculia bacterium]
MRRSPDANTLGSEIFEVEDAAGALPERLILKRLNAEMSALPSVRAAFADEARMLRELRHPNVVTFRRCHFDPQQRVCLLMEKVEGEPLDAWVRRHAGTPDSVFDLFDQVLGAVDYLHHRASPFLHLDLKPDNVLVAPSPEGPRPVLIDFGIARRAGGQGLKAYTPGYAAPEQAAGGLLGCTTDAYALGQMLEEILATLGIPVPRLQAVAFRAKSDLPQRRFADAGEMRLAFRRARRSEAPAEGAPARPPSEPRRVPRAAVAVGLAVLAMASAVGLAVRWADGSPDSAPPKGSGAAVKLSPSGEALRSRFRSLQSRFEETVIDRHCSLSDPLYLAARDLSDTLPEPSEDGSWMKRELDDMRRTCQATEANGPESEAILAGLRQKHLAYTQP